MHPTHPPLRIGVLGCANIARFFVRDVRASPAVQVVAVASRDTTKAATFAAEFGIARAHGSYEALLDDAGVDAIYLPLPNSLHAPWAQRAAAAGKHVLCEKPLAVHLAEAQAMFDAARRHGVLLLEAYPYWFQPQTGALVQLLQAGAIGSVRSVQASFGFTLRQPAGNIRMDPALGGGALLDAGSYPLSLIRLVMGAAPQRVQAEASYADSGVDISLSGTLLYADGRRAQLSCAMDVATHRHASIVGTAGVIETEYLNHTAEPGAAHPWGWQPSQMRLRRGTANNLPFETVHSATGSGFRFAAEAFARVVAAGDTAAIDRAAAASLDIAATLEALARSARLGHGVDVDVPGR
ncbi:Gfo/Idh/MocA family protein [Rubrivivax sp. RP6-9]|uniref:Gfo/Idh/MocA family protein n=1 Tax=Rubrivivax sp. RP6-9 TaxID=3415750 RepID=UPI003CC6625D